MKRTKLATLGAISLMALLIQGVQVAEADVVCKPTSASAKTVKIVPAPTRNLDKLPALMSLKTNCGDIDIQLSPNAPITLTHLTTLANAGYYDGTLCHRLTTAGIFVIQCGDPTATGLGIPGWSFADENLPSNSQNNYPAGTVAMANGGPNTNGSQFFITYEDSTIGPNYSIWGRVITGLDILKFVASKGVVGGSTYDGAPAQKLGIDSIEIGDPYALTMFNKGLSLGAKNLSQIESEYTKNTTLLNTANQLNKQLQSKLSKICKVKPKPKGC